MTALDGLDLHVEQGEIFGFLGANGAGKTTAIHLAMGFLHPTSGAGEMLARPFGDVATRARVGFLGENVALYPRRAESLLRFYGALNGMPDSRLRQRVREVLSLVSLEDRARDNVKSFSRGMQQRIGLAQAMINDPDLLVLDEPTSALDPLSRIAVREMFVAARSAGKTIFLSSHMLSEIEQVCDRVAILRRGKVVRIGTIKELLEESDRFEIRAKGVKASDFPGSTASGEIVIVVPRSEQRLTLERIWAAGGEVESLSPQRRSLEDLFLSVTEEGGPEER